MLPISILVHLLGIGGDAGMMQHDGAYVENWWVTFIEIARSYPKYYRILI